MRIIGGTHRGRPLKAPEGKDTRPTLDRVRENVFNIADSRLEGGIQGKVVLDAFAGSGALGLEAASRGAEHVTFIENARTSVRAIQDNIATLNAHPTTTVLQQDATHPLAPSSASHAPCALVFLDPPYGLNLVPSALTGLAKAGWLALDALCIAEIGRKETIEVPDGFDLLDERTYGAARIVLLQFTSS